MVQRASPMEFGGKYYYRKITGKVLLSDTFGDLIGKMYP